MSQVTASFNRPTPLNPTKAVLVQYVSALIDDNSVNFWTKDSLGAPEAIPDHFFQQTVACLSLVGFVIVGTRIYAEKIVQFSQY